MTKPETRPGEGRGHRRASLSQADAPAGSAEPAMKRLSIDIPADLHTRIKVSCAQRGLKITDEVRALLEREFRGLNRRA